MRQSHSRYHFGPWIRDGRGYQRDGQRCLHRWAGDGVSVPCRGAVIWNTHAWRWQDSSSCYLVGRRGHIILCPHSRPYMFLQSNLSVDARHGDCGICPAGLGGISEIEDSVNCCHDDGNSSVYKVNVVLEWVRLDCNVPPLFRPGSRWAQKRI